MFELNTDRFSVDMEQPIGGVKSSDLVSNGLGIGRGFHLGAICNDPMPNLNSAWVVDNIGNLNLNAKIVDEAVVRASPDLGVYRPKLEDRKVGKVGMHFVDDGFPLALREVAKVMTWAADVKGYKLHDWRNLPNAEVAFPSAGYRHRNDNSVQKAEGLKALERLDHESNLLHKAHECFNVLAELELVLAGKIV